MGREEGNEGRGDKGFEQWLMTVQDVGSCHLTQ